MGFKHPPPATSLTLLSFPAPHVLLVTLNRPRSLNCISLAGHEELEAVFGWLDAEPSLRVGILTGSGRSFCAGADLKEWNETKSAAGDRRQPRAGFGGLSQRNGPEYKKPIIAAVNGLCLGGGMEMVVNADLVVADGEKAVFAMPEVKRGVVAIAGALPRFVRTVGRQRAMELALTGRNATAEEMERWGVVNRVVRGGCDALLRESLKLAQAVAENSPDAVIITRQGVENGWSGLGVRDGSDALVRDWNGKLAAGENYREGLEAFAAKRTPVWRESKL